MTQAVPSRSLQTSALPAPTAARARAVTLLASATRRALPVVAESVAAGVALLAAERAVHSVIVRVASRVLAAEPMHTSAPARRFASFNSYTETTIVERRRARR